MGNDISLPVVGGSEKKRLKQEQQLQQQAIEQQASPSPSTSSSNLNPGQTSANADSSQTNTTVTESEAEANLRPSRSASALRTVATKPAGPIHDPMETPPTAQPDAKPKKKTSKVQLQEQVTQEDQQVVTQPPPTETERSVEPPETLMRSKEATTAGIVPDVDYPALLKQITTTQSPDDQSKMFLHAFVYDFANPTTKFEEVLNICEHFKRVAPQGSIRELDASTAQSFMANYGIVAEGIDFRALFNLIDVDANLKLSLIEFLLYKYRKPLPSLFSAKSDPQALSAMENNIQVYRKVLDERRENEERIALLDKAVDKIDKVYVEERNVPKVAISIKPAAQTQQSQQPQPQQSQQTTQQDPAQFGKYQVRSATARAALESRSRAKEAKEQVSGINDVMAQTLAGAQERGDKLQSMEHKTAELAHNANEYMKSIQKLKKQQENRSWWQM